MPPYTGSSHSGWIPPVYVTVAFCDGALLIHLLSKLYQHTSVASIANLSFSEWAGIFGDAKMTTALLDRLTLHCLIVDTGNGHFRFKARAAATKKGKEKP